MKRPDLNKMTLREKVAQTLLVRQSDLMMKAECDYGELRDPKEAKEILDKNQFGGIWAHGNEDVNGMSQKYDGYFGFTTKSLLAWINENTKDMKIRPICASDADGSAVCLDMSTYIKGLIVGAANSEEYAYEMGKCIGEEYKAAGGNWLWTPSVDLLNRFSPGIVRPASNKPEQIISLSKAIIEGMQSVGVAACAKHFPGTDGKETRDSHIVNTNMKLPIADWEKGQGAIFQAMVDAGVYTVMANARTYPDMDDTKHNGRYLPAGLSKKMLIDYLKGKMGFEGVVITDDVNMGGYTSVYPEDELYARFLEAGCDVVLGVGIDALDKVMKCVERGIVTEERIDDACRRIFDLKEKLGLFDDDYERGNCDIEDVVPRTKENAYNIARDGITLLRDNIGLLPVKKDIKHVTIYTYTHKEDIYTKLNAMKEAFEERGAEVSLNRRPESFEEIEEAAKKSDLIIYAGYIGFHAPKGAPSFYDDEFWALRYAFTAGKEKSIGLSLGYPFIHYNFMDDSDVFVNLYTPNEDVQRAFVAAVYGEHEFKGVAPLNMEID